MRRAAPGEAAEQEAGGAVGEGGHLQAVAGKPGDAAGFGDNRGTGAAAQQGLGDGEGLIFGDGADVDEACRVEIQGGQAGGVEVGGLGAPEQRGGAWDMAQQAGGGRR